MTEAIGGLAEVARAFDGVMVDQYGVLHDGRMPFPGARACLEKLHARGTPVVALTNSGKRAAFNTDRLARLGFPSHLFAGVVSSGELARTEIERRLEAGRLERGAGVAIVSRDRDAGVIEGLDVRQVLPGPDADLLVIAGAEPERLDRAQYRECLAPLAARGVPAICANPDRLTYAGDGVSFGAGLIAEDYEEAGGTVEMVGKPGPAMFLAALGVLGAPPRDRVLMIGDSPEHDIAGAAGLGCATLLIRGGIQAGTQASGAAADYAMNRLVW